MAKSMTKRERYERFFRAQGLLPVQSRASAHCWNKPGYKNHYFLGPAGSCRMNNRAVKSGSWDVASIIWPHVEKWERKQGLA